MKKYILLFAVIFTGTIYAQDILGAYIQTKCSGLTYSTSVTVFTDASLNISHPTIPMVFENGTNPSTVGLSSSFTSNGISTKTYSVVHTYTSAGTHITAYFPDTFRVAGIKNISNSQTKSIAATAAITASVGVINSSPLHSNNPFISVPAGTQVLYNPGYTDADGDSLFYELTASFASNYIPAGASVSPATGLFTFQADTVGLYAFSMLTHEFRKNTTGVYYMLDYTQMDFVVRVTGPTGIPQTAALLLKATAFPSPVKDKLVFSFEPGNLEPKNLIIVNTLGQTVLQVSSTSQKQEIDISTLPAGAYYLKTDNETLKPIKLIKE